MTHTEDRHHRAETLLGRLRAEHEVLKHCRPLDDTQVEADLLAAHQDESAWLIRLALHLHLTGDAYLQSLCHGGKRFRLDGEPSGEVDGDARHHARALLKHRRAHRGKRGHS